MLLSSNSWISLVSEVRWISFKGICSGSNPRLAFETNERTTVCRSYAEVARTAHCGMRIVYVFDGIQKASAAPLWRLLMRKRVQFLNDVMLFFFMFFLFCFVDRSCQLSKRMFMTFRFLLMISLCLSFGLTVLREPSPSCKNRVCFTQVCYPQICGHSIVGRVHHTCQGV